MNLFLEYMHVCACERKSKKRRGWKKIEHKGRTEVRVLLMTRLCLLRQFGDILDGDRNIFKEFTLMENAQSYLV